MNAERNVDSWERFTVAGLVVVALLIRTTRLGESLWYDEIAAWSSHAVHGPVAIIDSFFEPSNHIFHTLLSWASVALLQEALTFEIALRLPALLFSLGTVVAIWVMARQVLGRPAALTAAALAAFLPVYVLEGTEARGYSMMIFFSALAHWAFLANRAEPRLWRWGLYSLLCAAGIWAHFVTAFVPIGHAAWLGWRALRHGEVRAAVRGGGAIALTGMLALGLYAAALPQMIDSSGIYVAADGPAVFGPEGWHAFLQLGGSWYAWAAGPGLLLALVGLVVGWRTEATRDAIAITLVCLPLFVLTVLLAGSWMYARFALFSLPGAALLIAIGLDFIRQQSRVAGVAAGVLVVGVCVADLFVRPSKQPLRDAAAYVVAHRVDNQRVLVIGIAHAVIDIYLAGQDPSYSFRHGGHLATELPVADPDWIVLYYPNHVSEANYQLLEDRGYIQVQRFRGWVDWNNGDVLVYRR